MKILFPLPLSDFDPSEAAIPWQFLKKKSIEVHFATSTGVAANCDQVMLTGQGLGWLSGLLAANSDAVQAYQEMASSPEFQKPLKWSQVQSDDYDGIILVGGHAPRMKEYLESAVLQNLVAEFFAEQKKVGAICHGVVLVARSQVEGKSVLFGRKTTALLKSQELSAWALTMLWMKNYYRTYPETVEDEVRRRLQDPADFIKGPTPLRRDREEKLNLGFVVRDRNYLSARWPGDAHQFAHSFYQMLIQNSK